MVFLSASSSLHRDIHSIFTFTGGSSLLPNWMWQSTISHHTMASELEVPTLITASHSAANQTEGHSPMKLAELPHRQKAGHQTLCSARPWDSDHDDHNYNYINTPTRNMLDLLLRMQTQVLMVLHKNWKYRSNCSGAPYSLSAFHTMLRDTIKSQGHKAHGKVPRALKHKHSITTYDFYINLQTCQRKEQRKRRAISQNVTWATSTTMDDYYARLRLFMAPIISLIHHTCTC